MTDVSAESEELEDESERAVSVESEHVENLTNKEFDRELIRRISEVEGLRPEYIASLESIMLDMSDYSAEPEDFD